MKTLLVVLLLGVVLSDKFEFDKWAQKHGKLYKNWQDRVYREGVWIKNMDKILQHNKLYEQGEKSYTLAMNEHGDLTHEEFRKHKTCLHRTNNSTVSGKLQRVPKINYKGAVFLPPGVTGISRPELPVKVNYTELGYVTPVKDQAQCGSCWAFSTTGALEGQTFRKTGTLPNLSEQQLVDCAGRFGNAGCDGGLMDMAFLYTMSVKGLMSEADYPYTATDGAACLYKAQQATAGVAGFLYVPKGDEDQLTAAIALNGPVSVAIDASHSSFQFYSSGVYNEEDCSPEELDHGVLAVGYGTYEGTPYFLVKNSWGTGWGQGGYIMMSRNGQNQCGIASYAVLPLVPSDDFP